MRGRVGVGCAIALALAGCGGASQDGAALFGAHCAACHGAAGIGGAEGPDLTGLAAANGGVFPADEVIAQIHGYAGRHQLGRMPEFAALFHGPSVTWTTQDGANLPTSVSIIRLTRYLETLQKPQTEQKEKT